MLRRAGALLVAVTTAAVLAPGLALAPAHAADAPLTTNPSATTIRSLPLDPAQSDRYSAATYGLSLNGVDPARPVKVAAYHQPNDPRFGLHDPQYGDLLIQTVTSGGPRASGWSSVPFSTVSLDGAPGLPLADVPTGSERYFIGVKFPSEYFLVFYQENALDGSQSRYDPDLDRQAVRITLEAADVNAVSLPNHNADATAELTTTPAQMEPGNRVSSTLRFGPVSTVDVRGSSGGAGVLGAAFGGTGRIGGPVTITYQVSGHAAVAYPWTYTGDENGGPVFTAQSRVVNELSLVKTFVDVGHMPASINADVLREAETIVGQPTTLAATPQLRGPGKTILTGTGDPGAKVYIYSRTGAAQTDSLRTTLVANADGSWRIGTSFSQTTGFLAITNGKSSGNAFTTLNSYNTAQAKALGDGKVQFTVKGTPDVRGFVNVYYAGTRIGHVRTDKHGDAVLVVQSTPGRRTFEIYFQAPYCDMLPTSLTGTVQ